MSDALKVVQSVIDKRIREPREVRGELVRIYTSTFQRDLIVVFADGRFAIYRLSCYEFSSGNIEFLAEGVEDLESLVGAGLLSRLDCNAYIQYQRQQVEEQNRQAELEMLAALKKKYESSSD